MPRRIHETNSVILDEFAFAPPATPPLGPALWYGPGASAANGKASRRYYRGGLRLFALKVNARNGAPRGSTCTRGPEPGPSFDRLGPALAAVARFALTTILLRVPMIDPPI